MLTLLSLALAQAAHAFCGFYVSGADASLYNNATLTVLVRSGTRTVLSMQNNYEGPPSDFAMVVPVPEVLSEENVKTLPREIFGRVDQLAAPRLVEYWEQDPCAPSMSKDFLWRVASGRSYQGAEEAAVDAEHGVTVEARFAVGEYDIVILSARDSGGLEGWLRASRYNIPAGASRVLAPYVAQGTKFFVAKVDAERVVFQGDRAVLSPLRMHFDSADFSLPVRLGLLNSRGEQDLLVHIIADRRYEVANYPNRTIPTNVRLTEAAASQFPAFYEALFSQVGGDGTVVTEYAWQAVSCDPCPTPPLDGSELLTLGTDVAPVASPILTRLHLRYTAATLGRDLVFREADPIIGGRGMPDEQGRLGEPTAAPSQMNQFQGRYVILHPWKGPVACSSPVRGTWGGSTGPVAAASRLTTGGASPPPARLADLLAEAREDIAPISPKRPSNPNLIPEIGE